MTRPALLAALALLAAPAPAQEAAAPLSAIDWLSESVESASAAPVPPAEPPVATDATTPTVTVTPLDSGESALRGVLPPEVTGLATDLWARSDEATLVGLLQTGTPETVPALQDLVVTLMLAEAAPPAGSDGEALFLARTDRLLDMGALEAAQSLLESGDLLDPETFRRWFDVTLLTGNEAAACALLKDHASLAPTLEARVFCMARNGDWNAAALTVSTARALGDLSADDELLLARFLDPDVEPEEGEAAALPARPSPLVYRMREAVGDLMPTTGLPLAFSHADLRDTVAWRAQIEAAERLARHGGLSENVLLGVYTARKPAASGGIWDRAAAVQALDAAVAAKDPEAAAKALPVAWAALQAVQLEVPLAKLYGEPLAAMNLPGDAGALAWRLALLSPAYEGAARARTPGSPQEAVWRAVAIGETEGLESPDAATAAVLDGFREPELAGDLGAAVAAGRTGEAILRAIAAFDRGLDGDRAALTQAIATLRAVGLEDPARRAALQYLLLDAQT